MCLVSLKFIYLIDIITALLLLYWQYIFLFFQVFTLIHLRIFIRADVISNDLSALCFWQDFNPRWRKAE